MQCKKQHQESSGHSPSENATGEGANNTELIPASVSVGSAALVKSLKSATYFIIYLSYGAGYTLQVYEHKGIQHIPPCLQHASVVPLQRITKSLSPPCPVSASLGLKCFVMDIHRGQMAVDRGKAATF